MSFNKNVVKVDQFAYLEQTAKPNGNKWNEQDLNLLSMEKHNIKILKQIFVSLTNQLNISVKVMYTMYSLISHI